MSKYCICEFERLEQGDTLYAYKDIGSGITRPILYSQIKYCPVCGKELPTPSIESSEIEIHDIVDKRTYKKYFVSS